MTEDRKLEPSASADGARAFAAAHLTRNFTALALDFGLFGLGTSFSSTATVLPALAERLGASNLIIGALPSIALLGQSIPALFSARLVEPLPRKLPFVLTYTTWERLPWLVLAVAVLTLSEFNPGLVLAILVGTLAVVALAAGIVSPAWQVVVGRVIPTTVRGRFFAAGSIFATSFGLIGALVSGHFLSYPFPLGFALCLGATFVFLMASYGAMALALEPVETSIRPMLGLSAHLASLPHIFTANASFRRYLIAQGLRVLGLMATSFYTVFALRVLGAREWNVASFTFAMLAAQSVGALVLGIIADHRGHRTSLLVGAGASAAASVVALVSSDLTIYHMVFALTGVSNASTSVSSQNLVLELSEPANRPTYLGLATAAQTPFALAAPLIGSLTADYLGLRLVFVVAGVAAAISALVFLLQVEEPRRRLNPRQAGRTGRSCSHANRR